MLMGNKKSFTFISMAAIDEAIRQTSGGCTPICDHHRAMYFGPLTTDDEEKGEESEDENEGPNGDCNDEYDGT